VLFCNISTRQPREKDFVLCKVAVVPVLAHSHNEILWDDNFFDTTGTHPCKLGYRPKSATVLTSTTQRGFFVFVANHNKKALFIRYPSNARADEERFHSCEDMKMTIERQGTVAVTCSCSEITADDIREFDCYVHDILGALAQPNPTMLPPSIGTRWEKLRLDPQLQFRLHLRSIFRLFL
jgi:hypothetical protein